jgi:hypothetical protein
MLNVMSKRKNEKESPERSDKRKTTVLGAAVVLSLVTLIALVVLIGPRLSGFLVAGTEFSHQQAIGQEFSSNANYTLQLEKLPSENFTLKSLMVSGSVIGDGSAKVYLVSGDKKLRVFDSSSLREKISPITAFSVAEQPEVSVQPELPPSSELDNAQGGAGTDTTPAGSPGAENPPAEVPPIEQLPIEQPPEAPANETLPAENITIPSENLTQEIAPENITNITEALLEGKPFQNLCIDTCSISEFLDASIYTLEIEVEPGTILALDSATYTLFVPETEVNITNISNETVFFVTNIQDANNDTVNAVIEFADPATNEIEAIGQSQEGEKPAEEALPLFQAAAVVEEQPGEVGIDIPKGEYNIKVKPQDMPVQEIVFENINISQNIMEFIKLDDVPENVTNLSDVIETYAIDPTAFNFTTATVTATAKGDTLYKCKDWDFANQICLGDWAYLQSMTIGEPYSFTLTPDDPAYSETIQNMGFTNDSYVDQANSGTNYGTATTLYVQSRSSSRNRRVFERFNLSDIPSDAQIVSANLSLYKTGGTGSSTRTYNLYRVTASWTEAGITWTNQPAVSGTLTSSTSVPTGTNNVWRTWNVTSDVRGFVNGTYSNYGWRISDNSESSSTQYASNFASEENANTTIRPKLDIYYIVPPTTPTNITCNGGSCNSTFYDNITLQCSGSTAGNSTITYVIDANYSAASASESSIDVPTSCRTDTYTTGQDYEFYSKWTIPGSGNATLTGFDFYDYDGTLSGSENIQMALYEDGGSYNKLSEIVTITGAGAVGWLSKNLTTPITITLGNTYWIAVGPSGTPTYSIARDASADCASYPPTGTGSYYQTASGGLDASVPTGATQSVNKYIIPGIVYTTSGIEKTWRTIGNHTNGSTYLWNLSGIAEQSDINLRCNATSLAGSYDYSGYFTGSYNLTVSSAPPPDTTPPAAVTNLDETSTGQTWIYWAWTNPADSDFSQAIIYIDGSNVLNTSNAYYNATGFSCSTQHNITIRTKDTTGNVNTTNVTDSAVTSACSDTTPPATVTNLASPSQGTTWIYWTWTNPADSDFNYTKVWVDGSYTANVTKPSSSYNATGFSAATSHAIGTQTVDNSSNVNTTFVNNTAQTLAVSAGQNTSVLDANGIAVNATLTIINSTGQTVYVQTGTVYNFNLFAGNYTIIIQPANSVSVKSITYYNYTVDGSFALPGFDEPTPAAGALSEYAVNPLGQFQTATLTVNLTGDVVTKCDNYTFTTQTCEENQWHTVESGLTSGTLYNITLTPGDPGFAIFNGTSLTNDTQIYQASPTSNYGAATTMIVGKWNGATRAYRSLIKFNLSSIPTGVQIDKANLTFYVTATDAGARTHNVYKVYDNRSWVELQATWNRYTTANLWTTAGGDYNATLSTSTGVGVTGYYSFNVTNDVQIFADNQSKNQGWIIIDSNEATQNTRKTYTTSNSGTANRRPLLQINWTDIQAPRWSSQSQNASVINNTDSVKLSAYWTDNINLSYAVLSTNESGGVWANKTGVYGSPLSIGPSTGNWSNFTWSNNTASGIIGWAIWANDTQGNWNVTANGTINVTIADSIPPIVTASAPVNNSLDGDGSVLFNCSATDAGAGLANISLYLNSVLNQTNSVTGGSNSTTFSKVLANNNYNWYCRAADALGNANNSAAYTLVVNTAAVPISTEYTGNTTNWAEQDDLNNVCTATLEVPGVGQISWYNCVNASYQNFDTNVNISANFVEVNFGLNPTFNSSAHIVMRGLTWDSDPEILMNGILCDNVTVCQNATYNNATGVLIFDTTHFTNFTTIGNARLVIWDQNDTGMPGGNLPACLGNPVNFFANYTRSSNGNPIVGATCIINFTDSSGNSMGYNGTSTFYGYNRTFSTVGLKAYNASCVKTTPPARQYIALSDSVNITDCAPPQWSNNQSSTPVKYNASQSSVFNITWTDFTNVSTVQIEGNWSGSPTNYTPSLISGNTANGVWSYSQILPAGTWYWKSYANDTSNNRNATSTFVFTIARADNPVNLYLNGTQGNNTYTYPQAINATGTALLGTVYLYRDNALLASGASPQANISVLGNGTYAYKVNATDTTNYSDNTTGVTYYAFVNKATSTCSLLFNPISPITYGAAVNVSCSCNNPEASAQLYRNSTNVTSEIGQNVTLGAGTWSYVCNVSQSQNYTSASNSSNFVVNPAASQVDLLLDGVAANKTVEVGSTVNLTATMITPGTGVVQLYRSGALINSGTAPITNLSTFSTLNTFNITAVYPATQNYSASYATWFAITQDTTKPNVYLTSPANNAAIASQTQSFVFNATDNYYTALSCTLYINNVPSGANGSVAVSTPTTITNTTMPEGNNNWYVNCTDGSANTNQSETRVLTVDLTPPVITHIRPVQSEIVGYNVTLDVDITDNLLNISSARYEISNSSGIVKSGTLPGLNYQDVWDSHTVQDGSYTFRAYANDTVGNPANSSVNFTVDNTAPFIQILTPQNGSQWNSDFNLNVTLQNTRINASNYNITNSTGAVVQSNANNSINSPTFAWADAVNVASLPTDTYVLTVYARDSVGYETLKNSTFVIDKIAPQYLSIAVSPASPATYSPSQSYQFNATWTDNIGVDTVIFEFNGTNYTDSIQTGNVYSKNFTGLNAGNYNYKWYANDTTGNWNNTGTFTYTVNKAPTTTTLYLNGSQSNLTITYSQTSNATAATSVGSVILYRDSVNITNPEISVLGASIYNYTAVNLGDSNYFPSSATWYLIVNKANPAVNLLLDGAAADKNVTYPTQTNATGFEGNIGDSDVTYTLFRNGVSIGSGASVSDVQTLGVNTYTYIYNTTGGTNYTSATISRTLTVNKQITAVNLYLNGNQSNLTITYGAQSNVTATDTNGTLILYRNGTNVSNPDIQTLGVGTYNYTAIIPDDINRTGSSKTYFLTVQKATPSLNLLLNGAASNLSVIYPTSTNATASEANTGDTDLVYTLYRDSTTIGSGSTISDVQTLGANTYVYTYNTSGGTNYTSTSLSRVLTINQGSTDVRLFLNGVEGNNSQTYGTNSNATATLNVSGLTFQLFRDGVPVASGNSSINEVATLAAQTYNYTALFAGNINYTGDSQTYFLTINRATPTFSLLLNGADSDVSVSVLTPVTINASATAPAGANVELYEDNSFVANGSAPSALRNYATAGNRTWKVNISITQNYTSGSKNHTVVVFDNSPPQYSNLVTSPSSPTTYSPSQNYQFNATWTDNVAVSYVTLQFNGANYSISNSGSVYYKTFGPLAAGNYSYTWYANDTSNNWNNTGALTYTINRAAPVLTLNASPGWTNTYGTQTNISCTTNIAEVTPQLFRNGVNVTNPDVQTLGVNVYNYTCNNTATQNYTTTTTTNNLTINKAADTVNLYLNGNLNQNLTISFGTQSNATATSTSGTQQLFRDNVGVGNPQIATLGYGTYAYKANSTGNANYTGSSGVTYYLSVTKIPSAITLLLNGTNGDFTVNRSQSVNITGIRTTGEGSMQLYDNGTLINSGAPVITNITSYAALGQRNITLNLPETQNYSASTAAHFLSVYGILSAYVTAPTGTPKYYEGQNITFKGYVRDELGNPIDGATVTFEPINGSYVYVCSSSSGEGSGVYNCTLDTTGMASPRTYNLRINASKTNYNPGTYTNSSIFFLESGQKANLLLHKIPSVQAINSSHITYNVSLHVANGRGTSDNTTLKDPDANQTWNEGSIYGAQEVIESYLLTYNRGSADSIITLQKANATGYDPFYNTSLFVESNQPSIIIPQNITGAQLALVKNILFVDQTTTNITYTIVDTIVNSGGSDLSGIPIVDSDIGLTTTASIARGNSATYSGNKTITKNSQSYTYNFTQTSAFANSQFFYSNQPSIQIPGYGGPYDVIIDSLPASVNAGSTITGIVKAINMNTEVSEDRTLTTWIEDSNHTVLALDVRTIFIGRNQSATTSVTLTAPSTAGAYNFVSVLTWPTATANATKAFTVMAVQPPTPTPAPGGGAVSVEVPTNITNVTIIQPIAVIPNDIIQDLINLINAVREIEKKPMDEQMQLLEEDIEDYIVKAEDAAAQGKYDEARNDIRTAYGKLQIYNRLTPSIIPTIKVSTRVQYVFWGTLAATVIFIIVFFVKRMEEMAAIELLREERKHLENLYTRVDNYLNKKRDNKHEV